MGRPFKIRVKIAPFGNGVDKYQEVDVIVDSGATYTSIPASLLKQLSIPTRCKMQLRLQMVN